jgi:hypothetical protein
MVKHLFNFIVLIVLSWVLVHILAVFGFFLAAAYPIWWLVSPEIAPNILRKDLFNKYSSRPFKLMLFNSIFIVFVSFISITAVYAEAWILRYLLYQSVPKTATFETSDRQQFKVGDTIPMKIEVKNVKTAVNAVRADIKFDNNFVEVVDISTSGSFATIFVDKKIDNPIGFASISGGLPYPGAQGDNLFFAVVYLHALQAGAIKIEYLPSSMVLANDGRGTNILGELKPVSYFIEPVDDGTAVELNLQSNVMERSGGGDDQLYFFDITKPGLGLTTEEEFSDKVLGASDPDNLPEDKSLTLKFIEFLMNIDEQIVKLWRNLFSKIFPN